VPKSSSHLLPTLAPEHMSVDSTFNTLTIVTQQPTV
jgi:hypothetical protein